MPNKATVLVRFTIATMSWLMVCVMTYTPACGQAPAAIGVQLTRVYDAILSEDFSAAETSLRTLDHEIALLKSEDRVTPTILAEKELLWSAYFHLSTRNSILAAALATPKFLSASKLLAQHWIPVANKDAIASAEELLTLRDALDRFERVPMAAVGQLPVTAQAYLRDVINDAGRILHNSHYSTAKSCYQRALAIAQSITSEPDENQASILSNLANLEKNAGFLRKALWYQQMQADVAARCHQSPESQATTHINYGALLEEIGDPLTARSEYEKARELLDSMPNPRRGSLFSLQDHLASLASKMNEHTEALNYSQKLLELLDKEKLFDNEVYGRALNNHACYLGNAGKLKEAGQWIDQALHWDAVHYPAAAGVGYVTVAKTHALAAEIFLKLGDTVRATSHLSSAESEFRKVFPEKHFPNGHLTDLQAYWLRSRILAAQGERAQALQAAEEGLRRSSQHFVEWVVGASPADANRFVTELPQFRDQVLRLLPSDQLQAAYPYVWETKSNVARLIRWRNLLWQSKEDPQIEATRRELLATHKQLQSDGTSDNPNAQFGTLAELRRATMKMSESINPQDGLLSEAPGYDALLAVLPSTCRFVDIVRQQSSTEFGGSDQYLAFVLRGGTSPQVVHLGPAEKIDALVLEFVQAIQAGSQSWRPSSVKLAELIWQPIRSGWAQSERPGMIIVSGDSALRRLPWDALPGEQSDFLLREYQFSYVSSGPQLLESLSKPKIAMDSIDRVLMVDNLDYGPGERSLSSFPDNVSEDLKIGNAEVVHLNGQITPDDLALNLSRVQISHIASHVLHRNSNDDLVGLNEVGIAAFGANSNNADGFLWGSSISSLALQDLLLCDVAGCRSGLEDLSVGQSGVSTVQDALHLAGARTTVGSLWNVNSTLSEFLMQEFYGRLFQQPTLAPTQAMHLAKLAVLDRGPASDAQHPYFWANWRVSGPTVSDLAMLGKQASQVAREPGAVETGSRWKTTLGVLLVLFVITLLGYSMRSLRV